MPRLSVIISVYNASEYLGEMLDSVLTQSLTDLELICADGGSTDDSLKILNEYAQKDDRVLVLTQQSSNGSESAQQSEDVGTANSDEAMLTQRDRLACAACNIGLAHARGTYVHFLNAEDYLLGCAYEALIKKAGENDLDVLFCPGYTRDVQQGRYIRDEQNSFSALRSRDYDRLLDPTKDKALQQISTAPRTGIYRRSFLQENNIRFSDSGCAGGRSFFEEVLAHAGRIMITWGRLTVHRVNLQKPEQPVQERAAKEDARTAEKAAAEENARAEKEEQSAAAAPSRESEILEELQNFHRRLRHAPEAEAKAWYEEMQRRLTGNRAERVSKRAQILKTYDFAVFWQLYSRRLIVSVTSYPTRITFAAEAIGSILTQTLPADEVVLYLAAEQFPEGEESLPDDLRRMIASGSLTLRWCADLKPHKKYFYAFRDYPEGLIVTIDDDLHYAEDLLEQLVDTCLLFPQCIAASRVHLMLFDTDGSVRPYRDWIRETDASIGVPSMQLFATGGAGTLYPPHLLPEEMLDEAAIRETSLFADDLWLKAMETMADIPVVLCGRFRPLDKVPGSQEETLWEENVYGGRNDRQLAKIMAWTDEHFGPGSLQKKLGSRDVGVNLQGIDEVCRHVRVQQKKQNAFSRYLYARLDLKNTGADENDLEIISLSDRHAQVQTPAWFAKNGRGYVFRAREGMLHLAVRCRGDGELSLALRGPCADDADGGHIPVRIEYRTMTVDAQKVFHTQKSVRHDRPFRWSMPVRDGQVVTVQLEWIPEFAGVGSGYRAVQEERKTSRLAVQEKQKKNEIQRQQIRELKNELKEQKAQNARLKAERDASNAENARMKASLAWKIGRIITWLPWKIRKMFRKS